MPVFFVFIIILIVLWTIIASSTAAAKQKERERRHALQAELQQMAMRRAAGLPSAPVPRQSPGPRPPQRRISQGIADRFPDVLLPPTLQPQPSRPQQRPMPQRRPAPPPIPRATRSPVPASRRSGATPFNAPAPAISQQQPPPLPPNSPAAPVASPTSAARAGIAVDAAVIARWAQPNKLRQQFILTEIFQPPLALREPR